MNSGTSKRVAGAEDVSAGALPLIALLSRGMSEGPSDPQRLGLEDPRPGDPAHPVPGNRLPHHRDIEAHIVARHLVEIDDFKSPAPRHIGGRTVIAMKPGRLQLSCRLMAGPLGALSGFFREAQLIDGLAAAPDAFL